MRKPRLALVVVASLSLVFAAAGTASASKTSRHLNLLDDCDAATFNAAIGPGTCITPDGTTFSDFIGQLVSMGQAPAWRNAPGAVKLPAGGSIEAYNKGGEAHSFTEVQNFGGGCVAPINQLLGGLTPVPECATPAFGATLVPAGGELETPALNSGVHLFECLIHPWMRTTVTVD